MKPLDKGKDRLKKICDVLIEQTLKPAEEQAQDLVRKAEETVAKMKKEAEQEIEVLRERSRQEREKMETAFKASLKQAWNQTIETLKQTILNQLFREELQYLTAHSLKEKDVIAKIISALISCLEKEGIQGDLSVAISSQISPREINEYLSAQILQRLREKSVLLSSIPGGVIVKLHDEKVTLDFSENALNELMESFLRKDFRDFIFGI
jgi:V/A-type H+/Na+-transporting ATPase subunit E